jgi:ProP effector
MNNVNTSSPLAKRDKLSIIDWLIEHFPAAFFKKARHVKPLKIGIFDDILDFYHRLDARPFSKKSLRTALTYYCTSPAYLNAQKQNKARLDLFGNEMDIVTDEQAKYAQQRYERQYSSPRKSPSIQASAQPKDNLRPPAEHLISPVE